MAFTIVEVIVVVVIVAVLAGTVIPRLGNATLRQAENEAKAVRSLLTSVAQREAMSSETFALAFDPEQSRLGLLMLADAGEGQEPLWTVARGSTPITLSTAMLLAASSEGQALEGAWRVEVRPALPRPSVSLLLGLGDGNDRAWRIDLGAGQLVAWMQPLESAALWQPGDPASEDLDAKGARETPW